MQDKHDLYKKEILSTLDQLWKDNGQIKGFRYFADIAYKFFILDPSADLNPDIIVLGTGIPEVLLRAFSIRYRYMLGGIHTMTAFSDNLVPRDTDPVSRSILGAICAPRTDHTPGAGQTLNADHEPKGMHFDRSLFIIPMSSDSMRKIAYLLKEEGCKIFTLDVPPVHSDSRSMEKWEIQILRMMDAIAEHTHKAISLRKIRKAVRSVTMARYRLDEFLHETDMPGGCPAITGAGKMLIQNSYYYAYDLEDWGNHLKELQKEVRLLQREGQKTAPRRLTDDRPKILLTGSPVFFPNYKIPFLIEDVGLSIQEHIDASTVRQAALLSPKTLRSTKQAVHAISASSYRYEASAAYTSNDALMTAVGRALRGGQIEGVIFHILKGQIEYDFEMARMEEMFEHYGVPVFRLETDYQDHDIEQLRIRLEAFREMLSQARYSAQMLRRSS